MQGTDLNYAQQVFNRGGIIAYPTEAVWGLGCDPFNRQAVTKLLALKNRDISKGLILIAATIEQFSDQLTNLSSQQYATLADSWPSHNTWLVPNNGTIPSWIIGNHSSVALRVSANSSAQTLCNKLGILVSTSANLAGRPAATSVDALLDYFSTDLDYIYLGQTSGAVSTSSITDLTTGNQIR
jgi:L-threonylcarbamoyladenylate synthase